MTNRTRSKHLSFIALAIVVLGVVTACSAKKETDEQPDTGFGAIPPNAWVTNPPNKPAW